MPYSGPFQYGDRVQLTDAKRRHYTLVLEEGVKFHSHRGIIEHSQIVGMDEGSVVTSTLGSDFLLFRHLMVDHVLSMPRGAAVIYPKDSAQILVEGDIFMGARVLEAGAGSGALSMTLLRAVGPEGHVFSYEIREDHLEFAENNVEEYFGSKPEWWSPRLGDLGDVTQEDLGGPVDRIILDMLEPWEHLETVRDLLIPGGVFMTYVATVPQLMKVMEGLRELECFTEPRAWESLVRDWKVEGLATRPEHRMNAHTAFLIWTRRLADGVTPPAVKRRARR
ncbi:tRNA (adenine-N1)-methyltransferase [Corynebacterium ammoniagenes]|uniref:tRNA (adenine(58)-N(1))-methyltransferase TrmI n=2 Tax=Corynebacterium ammoniagenes TaxID=1697 RepID=A0AAV5G283_CORAM|nr:tRNA (adenine-N1)-methyltransferase [Corynebacterium ammoniagenes]APT82627.1 SAM-dependent methlyltransferase [Corynebacterium ammoniagenes DSM 20306]AQS73695.1 SAM-dependent methyltransferase [Corynebacterium ammoniagenes]EFG82360.1 tRNA methyltransferase complex GCD14 subunit [Corynebacterium ammoniagenes DSM 20306]GJN42463.1 SAM-dependent methyltransferase [Corynebacterium ammoniagenes]